MKPENQAQLLRAYRMAVEAEQDGIADILEDIIIGEMDAAVACKPFTPAFRPRESPDSYISVTDALLSKEGGSDADSHGCRGHSGVCRCGFDREHEAVIEESRGA